MGINGPFMYKNITNQAMAQLAKVAQYVSLLIACEPIPDSADARYGKAFEHASLEEARAVLEPLFQGSRWQGRVTDYDDRPGCLHVVMTPSPLPTPSPEEKSQAQPSNHGPSATCS